MAFLTKRIRVMKSFLSFQALNNPRSFRYSSENGNNAPEPSPVLGNSPDSTKNEAAEAELVKQQRLYYFFKENEKKFQKAKESINPEVTYNLFFDGGSSGNPGQGAIGYVIYGDQKMKNKKIYDNSRLLGYQATNNQAEFVALLFGMKSAVGLGIQRLECFGDSQLLIKQLNGEFSLKSSKLGVYLSEIKHLSEKFNRISYTFIERENNIAAHNLVQKLLNYRKESKFYK